MLKRTARIVFALVLLILMVALLTTLVSMRKRTVTRGYYYSENEIKKRGIDTGFIHELNIKRFYVRFLDVDGQLKGSGFKKSKIQVDWSVFPEKSEIVPIIHIAPQTFRNLRSAQELKTLQDSLARELHAMADMKKTGFVFPEIQFDCDWTEDTRTSYFDFLKTFKEHLQTIIGISSKIRDAKISAVIRLAQIGHSATLGVPPVDRGILVSYNLGGFSLFSDKNKLFDLETVKKQLEGNTRYGLPLDLVLPLCSRGVVFRNDKFLCFIPELPISGVDSLVFLDKKEALYAVNRDTVCNGTSLKNGDVIRMEDISTDLLKQYARLTRKMIYGDSLNVAFFSLDTGSLRRYTRKELNEVYENFK